MASSEEFPGFKISDLTPEERFSVYVKFGWQIFTITVQEIIEIALDKKGPVHYIFGLLVFVRFDQIQLSSFAQLILTLKSDLKDTL